MLVDIIVKADVDLWTRRLGKTSYIEVDARDPETGERFRRDWNPPDGSDIEAFATRTLRAAYRQFGLKEDRQYSSNYYGASIVDDDGETLATCERWWLAADGRRRRGEITLRAVDVEWEDGFPFPPTDYTNPWSDAAGEVASARFVDEEGWSCFSPAERRRTAERIREGLEATRGTLAFYERMAAIYEERTGKAI